MASANRWAEGFWQGPCGLIVIIPHLFCPFKYRYIPHWPLDRIHIPLLFRQLLWRVHKQPVRDRIGHVMFTCRIMIGLLTEFSSFLWVYTPFLHCFGVLRTGKSSDAAHYSHLCMPAKFKISSVPQDDITLTMAYVYFVRTLLWLDIQNGPK